MQTTQMYTKAISWYRAAVQIPTAAMKLPLFSLILSGLFCSGLKVFQRPCSDLQPMFFFMLTAHTRSEVSQHQYCSKA